MKIELDWAVLATCEANDCGVKRQFDRTVGLFCYPFQAEEFIEKCLPKENRHLFRVVRADNI